MCVLFFQRIDICAIMKNKNNRKRIVFFK